MSVLPLLLVVATSVQPPQPRQMAVLKSERIGDILARFEIIGETPKDSKALRVRLLSVPEIGECSGTPESCPKAVLYVVVSNFDLAMDVKIYTVPDKFGWHLVSWEHFPQMELPDDYVVFVIDADEPGLGTATSFWRPVRYRVKVNFHDGTITPVVSNREHR